MLRTRIAVTMSSSTTLQFLLQRFPLPQYLCTIKPLIPCRSLTIASSPHLNSKAGLSNTTQIPRLWSRINGGVRAASDESGSIDSSVILSMENKIKEQLNAEKVIVKDAYGDGRHVSIYVVSDAFEGKSAVNRQRMVYKAIWEELQSTVHAVDNMVTRTPSEAL